MNCGAGAGGGPGDGDGECAIATAGAGEGVGVCLGFPPSEAGPLTGPCCLPFLRFFAITTPAMMTISRKPSTTTTATITTTIQTGKLDFSFPSAFACWLL